MRLRKVKNAKEILMASPYYIDKPFEKKGKWNKVFNESLSLQDQDWFQNYFNPKIHLEIGCGKGQFLIEMAKAYPDINFIGMEYQESVLVRAIQKLEEEHLPNLKFICWEASTVDSVFCEEIDTLYLNFSDPWPKKKHAKRRLTSPDFLDAYNSIFKDQKTIILKTDNILLFGYSLENLSKAGYILERVSLDLENSEIPNIKTEYEEKFIKLGYKINYVKAVK